MFNDVSKVKTVDNIDPLYTPDDLSTSSEDYTTKLQKQKPKRRQKTDKQWKKERAFENKDLALQAVKHEDTWGFYHKNVFTDGNVSEVYRCNKVKARGEQCKAGIYLNYPSYNSQVILYRSQLNHTCHEIPTKAKTKMNDALKAEVRNLLKSDSKIKPKRIMDILKTKKLDIPKITDLNNYLAYLRKSENTLNLVNYDELERFCMNNSKVPDDDDTPFIVSFQVEYDEPTCFRFFISSKTLMKLAINVKHIHTDSTYKLSWQEFSVLLVGTTDRNGHFHAFGLGLCTNDYTSSDDFIFLFTTLQIGTEKLYNEKFNPKTLICDANHGIRKAFKIVFGEDTIIITCWVHMKKNLQKKAEEVVLSKEDIPHILSDLDLFQFSKNEDISFMLLQMLEKKWEKHKEFCEYLKYEWYSFSRNWYEGVKNLIPITNNALEAWSRGIKNEKKLRPRLPLSNFTVILVDYIKSWSNDYSTNIKKINLEPVLDFDFISSSCQWEKQAKIINAEMLAIGYVYTILSDDEVESDDAIVQKCENMDFKTLEEYKSVISKAWTITLPIDQKNWFLGVCDCPAFFKNIICKHIVGLAIRLKTIIPPSQVEAVSCGEKRKRGRPSKLKKDNLFQYENMF